jgi:chromosome segregation ATPase
VIIHNLGVFRHRRESTLRKGLYLEDDEELKELQAAVDETQQELDTHTKELSEVQEQERAEMDKWLAQYGVERLVHTERISVLRYREEKIRDRMEKLDSKRDLMEASLEFLDWVKTF